MVATLLVTASARAERKNPDDRVTHVVGSGETLSGIAVTYGVSVRALRNQNRLPGDIIRVGQKLVIPEGGRAPGRRSEGADTIVTHVVMPGETLGEIAAHYATTIRAIKDQNRLRDKDVIRIGQKLRIRSAVPARQRRKFVYTIEAGDTLTAIARRFGMSWKDIEGLNPRARADRLRIGDRLTLYKEGPESDSKTIGRASEGRLVNAEQLPAGPGYYRRTPEQSWGTNETITELLKAIAAVRQKHPTAHDLVVEHLSARHGGHMEPHKSHQSGRDVDLGLYFTRQDRQGPKRFLDFVKTPLDYEPTWTLLEALAGPDEERCPAEYVFLDYDAQKLVYTWAKKAGKPQTLLDKMFQYPRGKRSMRGIIRHVKSHRGHIHVRFKCPRGDRDCS